ncbi:MAG: oligosaccharide flippase family protein [Desulfofustis sp. PB-SRB1]|nr:oligosaccharide flippase family protein [Desulfofustis sp. PB-SRB1]
MLKRNIIANYLGQGWTALMGLAFIPLYIKYLGIEAYGLIGIFAVLTAWFSLLDMGMTPTLSREMAYFTGGHHSAQSIRDLLRTIEFIAFGVAALIAGSVAFGANWIARSWLQAETLPVEVVTQAFALMGLVTALRFIETIYRSSIIGLQRQVLFNVVNSSLATIRGLGAIAVFAWISPTIQAFFIWQGFLSLLTLSTLATIPYASLPSSGHRAHFSRSALQGVWRFAGGMTGITFLTLLLTQMDKILLSKLLSLSEYGFYTLAAVVAGALYMLISPITQAFYPRLCELYAQDDRDALIKTYHLGAQMVSVIAGSAAIVIIVFPETLLRLWAQDHLLAARSAPLLSLLMLGNLLNGLMWIPYQTQLAHGWTGLTIKINIVAVLFIVPAILWATPRYGAEGAAWVWVFLNAGYVLVGIHLMYQKILTGEKFRWYLRDLLFPLGASLVTAYMLKIIWHLSENTLTEFLLLLVAATITIGASLLTAVDVRRLLTSTLNPYFIKYTNAYGD